VGSEARIVLDALPTLLVAGGGEFCGLQKPFTPKGGWKTAQSARKWMFRVRHSHRTPNC